MKLKNEQSMGTRLAQVLIGFLIAVYVKFCYVTTRWTIEGEETMAIELANGPVLFALWHNRIIMMIFLWRHFSRKKLGVMISNHRDGLIIARAVKYLGVRPIMGSPKRGGAVALLEIVRCLNAGESIALTPDGPRGPVFQVKAGILSAAKKSQAVILPVAYAMRRHKKMKTWDGLVIPKPFTRGVFVVGEAMRLSTASDLTTLEKEATELARRLHLVTNRAESLMNL